MKKKLIEVALPLEAINRESAREKSIRHGHPSTLHLWWARRPLATCRAVLFASLVDDPSSCPDVFPTEEAQENERNRLFKIIEELVKWENTGNERVLNEAKEEIRKSCMPPKPPATTDLSELYSIAYSFDSYTKYGGTEKAFEITDKVRERFKTTGKWEGSLEELKCAMFVQQRASHHTGNDPKGKSLKDFQALYDVIRERWDESEPNLPPVLDPFCGGGSIPLEAQRLGLKAYASDLNPVAVLITKALIEIPPRFSGRPPVNPDSRSFADNEDMWQGARGLSDDIRYYGKWMRDEAEKRMGHLYPKVRLPEKYAEKDATVIAWLWARTVKCPNPACGTMMPLIHSFWLSTKAKDKAWIEPIPDKAEKKVRFEVRFGNGMPPDGTVNRSGARCITCGEPADFRYIRSEGRGQRMEVQLMAIVAESGKGRVYLPACEEQTATAETAEPHKVPDTDLPKQALGFRIQQYGMAKHKHLFSFRQLVALTTFSSLVSETREKTMNDAVRAGMMDDGIGIDAGGSGAEAYADAVATYLAFAVDKGADYWSNLCSWHSGRDTIRNTFARQALPMVWDYAEANPLSGSCGNWEGAVTWITRVVKALPARQSGIAQQLDAATSIDGVPSSLTSTDPPYYDNIGYADLSDFFYIWLRRSIANIYPNLFSTLLVPKTQELVAVPYRFGGDKSLAEKHFLQGLSSAFSLMRKNATSEYPLSVYYAFKQSETDEDDDGGNGGVASKGWEAMLDGLVGAGFEITGTWPMRTELMNRSVSLGSNALASSIVLICRPRSAGAGMATRKELVLALRKELPGALKALQKGSIAPVDFSQAAIGPGMAVFSRYSKVLESDGSAMSVRTALQMINQELDAYLAEQEGDFDPDTRFCIAWFEQHGMDEGLFGDADVLARAKNTSVEGLVQAGVLRAQAGKVRLLGREDYPVDWNPILDRRLTVWECTQQLIRALIKRGEEAAALLTKQMGGGRSEEARALAYRLYSICDRKGWTAEAIPYNVLAASWSEVQSKVPLVGTEPQGELEFL